MTCLICARLGAGRACGSLGCTSSSTGPWGLRKPSTTLGPALCARVAGYPDAELPACDGQQARPDGPNSSWRELRGPVTSYGGDLYTPQPPPMFSVQLVAEGGQVRSTFGRRGGGGGCLVHQQCLAVCLR